jgi:hypothetical protein
LTRAVIILTSDLVLALIEVTAGASAGVRNVLPLSFDVSVVKNLKFPLEDGEQLLNIAMLLG